MTYTQDFLECWQEYPNKKGKFKAFERWEKMRKVGELPDKSDILKAIVNQKKERAFLKGQNRFCPEWKHFSTWMNQHCWEDEVEVHTVRVMAEPARGGNGIQNLARAYNILCNMGEDKFRSFCAAVRMPAGDIEAVRNKFSGNFDIRRLAGGIG